MVSLNIESLYPLNKMGHIYRIPHYNKHKVSITRLVRRHWIKDTPSNNRTNTAGFIAGECSLIQNVAEALKEGYLVDLIVGPLLKSNEIRNELADLLTEFGEKRLIIHSIKNSSFYRVSLINGNILFEDEHLITEDYAYATIIENADSYNINLILNHFKELRVNGTRISSADQIRSMAILS